MHSTLTLPLFPKSTQKLFHLDSRLTGYTALTAGQRFTLVVFKVGQCLNHKLGAGAVGRREFSA